MTAPDPTTVVQNQFFPPGPKPADAIILYEGADPTYQSWADLSSPTKGGWWAWDLRSPILRLAWDLLRFMLIDNGKPGTDRKRPVGLRDSVNTILYQTDQNNQILRRMAQVANINITDITG